MNKLVDILFALMDFAGFFSVNQYNFQLWLQNAE